MKNYQQYSTSRISARRVVLHLAFTLPLIFSESSIAALTAGVDASINDLKKMSIEDLLNIEVVSVSRAPEKLNDAAASVQVITQEDIRRSGATTLPQALRLASNLQVAQKNSHDWGITARGFNTELANKLLVMIDGRTVYTPLFSGVFWNAQDYLLSDIDHIEVISGPGGTLWGANAVNGVINIITKKSSDTRGAYVEAGGGPVESFAGAHYGARLNASTDFRIYGKVADHDNNVLANGADAKDAWRMKQGGFRLDMNRSLNQMTLQGDVYDTNNETGQGRGSIRGANLLSRWGHVFGNESTLTLQAYYDHTRLDDPVPSFVINNLTLAPAGVLVDVLDTYDIDLQHRFSPASGHQVVWGLGYRHTRDEVTNIPALALYPANLSQDLYSGFIQDEVTLGKDVTVTAGTKIEHHTYARWVIEPSVHLQWNVNKQNMLWSAVSKAVRTPSRIDRDLSQPASGLVVLKGNNNFSPETVVAYEAGYRTQITNRTLLSIATFYNDYQHLRSTSITPATIIPFYFENNLQGYTYGAELNGTYEATDWWQLRLGYTFLSEHLRVAADKFDLSNAHNETADPEHQIVLRSLFELPRNVQVDASWRWVDELLVNNGPNVGRVPSYLEMDLNVGWRINDRFSLSIAGHNLLDAHHPEYGFPAASRIEAVRSVTGKLVWQL
ncbi:MAG TPA: TonB-dependent receptor [Steroidobacteraceae bacterium]|jgi:iron complex outermembrane receptor protein|nr:TonB-dependent receptor [Steroidobacteraceae bacterium]